MKRLLTLILIVCLLAGLSIPAGAAQLAFTDYEKIRNNDAIAMLVDLDLISGFDDGSFRPTTSITRAEIAKICSMLIDSPAQTAPGVFSDVKSGYWAETYIANCYAAGILSGDDTGRFYPRSTVTAQELAKMLMRCIGVDGGAFTGAGWADTVNSEADALGIFKGFSGVRTKALTRDEACGLIYNALQCRSIASYVDSTPVYRSDALLNPQTLLEYRFGAVRYEELLTGNEYADLAAQGGRLDAGLTKIEHHRAFSITTQLEMIGRYVVIYLVNGEVIGVPTRSLSEVYYTCSTGLEFGKLLGQVGYQVGDNTAYYINYDVASAAQVSMLRDHCSITVVDHTNDKTIDLVMATVYSPYRLGEIAAQLATEAPAGVKETDTVFAAKIADTYYLEP
ncbi:MAG: S-layer homology domain-containing protein [Oscillospiraceae bacterium]|nr:S-layer homology domain-containing protein [Oscillospiraceae bacterium]